jgi:hypothetical protein
LKQAFGAPTESAPPSFSEKTVAAAAPGKPPE